IGALDGADLVVNDGEQLSVLGPSGSGKSTMLRVVAGLEQPAAGRVSWNGRDLAAMPPHRRGFGLMFQDYVLFPHRDVAGNVAFALRMRGDSPAETRRRVAEVLAMVGLAGYEHRRVTELSGGEQQRVALARTLAPQPALLMLDEPLGALDRTLRQRLVTELGSLFDQLGLTILYVTHDQEEALALGDRVALMRDGRVETVMPPEELWRRPPSEFAARFLGLNNIADAEIDPTGVADTPWGKLPLGSGAAAGRRRVLLRPECFSPDAAGAIHGVVSTRRFGGDRVLLELTIDGAPPLEVRADWAGIPAVGEEIRLRVSPDSVVLVPQAAG
ncbi:MAG TPA: ABC transporter ATP-binding protein, partial [Candidatus Caenarcaniphilales bacterium]|nr:ABC transporter ATP-binding protein [Candidatus Caenarcaniphilales bacterium]